MGDLNRDGIVNAIDQQMVIDGWSSVAPPQGRISRSIASGGTDNIFGFTGQIYNQEVGTYGAYLYRMRWYDPQLGRFLSRDPAGYVDGMLLYAYVSGNPMVLIDPLGPIESRFNRMIASRQCQLLGRRYMHLCL